MDEETLKKLARQVDRLEMIVFISLSNPGLARLIRDAWLTVDDVEMLDAYVEAAAEDLRNDRFDPERLISDIHSIMGSQIRGAANLAEHLKTKPMFTVETVVLFFARQHPEYRMPMATKFVQHMKGKTT